MRNSVTGLDGVIEPSQQMVMRFGCLKVRHFSPLSFARRSLRFVPLPTPSFVRSIPLRVRIEVSSTPAMPLLGTIVALADAAGTSRPTTVRASARENMPGSLGRVHHEQLRTLDAGLVDREVGGRGAGALGRQRAE